VFAAGPHAHATDFDGHDGALLKLHAVRCEDREATLRLLAGREGDKSHDSAVHLPTNNRKLAEVLVQRDENARLLMRAPEDLLVSRVLRPFAGPHNVMPGAFEGLSDASPNASIAKNLQAALPPRAGSTRSCPTTRRA